MTRCTAVVAIWVLLAQPGFNAFSQQPGALIGDKVIPLRPNLVQTDGGETDKDDVPSICTVRTEQGAWLALSRREWSGRIRSEDVVPLSFAEDVFSRRIEANPGDWWATAARGLVHQWRKDRDRALADYTRALELKPENPDLHLLRGAERLEAGDLNGALGDVNTAIRLNPKDVKSLEVRAAIHLAKGDLDDSLADFDRAIALGTESAEAYRNRGAVRLLMRRWDAARADLEEALRLDPNDALTHVNLAGIHERDKDLDQAIAELDRAVELNPKLATAYSQLGELHFAKGEFLLAIRDFGSALEFDPEHPGYDLFSGRAWVWNDERDRTITDSDRVSASLWAAKLYVRRGEAWVKAGSVDRALADLDRAATYCPIDPKVDSVIYGTRGAVRGSKGADAAALADLDRAIELNSRNVSALIARGALRVKQGRWKEAMPDVDRAIEIAPTARNYVARAGIWFHEKEDDRAIADLNTAIRLDPKLEGVDVLRGKTWLRKREYAKAIDDFEEAIRRDPADSETYHGLASLLATCPRAECRNGRRAVELATRACESKAWKDARRLVTLAAAYAEAGDFPRAIEWQTKAIEATNSAATRKRRLERLDLYRRGVAYHAAQD